MIDRDETNIKPSATIDLNADIGEADNADWLKAEQHIISHISSANIACGAHAGSPEMMEATIGACLEKGVTIGAHPSYPDRANFGRKSLKLGTDIDAQALRLSLSQQIQSLIKIANINGAQVKYVKPHGALYNDAVFDAQKADIIASTIKAIDPDLIFLGGPDSQMKLAAQKYGLNFVAEGFIDRRYSDDGHLIPRSQEGAVIEQPEKRLAQACQLASTGCVETISGNILNIKARSLCVHGDSAGAVETARQARDAITAMGLTISAFAA